MTALIILTGGAGFIGSNIAAELNEAGHTDTVIIDWLGTERKWHNIAKRRFADFVFPEDVDGFLDGLKGADAVVHMGANSSTTATDGDEVIRSNFRLSCHLWNWCTATRTPFIYASSAATYGDGSHGFVDDDSDAALDALHPLNLYGWSKHAFDKWALERARRHDAPPQWAGLKFFNVYGPNEYHKKDMMSLVAKNTPSILNGQTIRLFKSHRPEFADGEQLRDFIYVKDCASVVSWLLQNRHVSGLFNLGTGKARSFRDLMMAVGQAAGKTTSIEFIDMPASIRDQYQYFTEASMHKLRAAGYTRDFYSLEEGVRDYVQTYLITQDPYR
ncbi:ADP-L-glycero-D-manno-heptose-6-epimerase [Granulibacter bethesdensis CGDNIH1]|uniref:ADP-L-glycero-D-manno-heptose-6-epimerase n=1 Tax=Granulibacter bethesdensis (strain ATCC BAA-1260 / CGDNIH1) TaxID=391165 RepID=Q0BRX1_GRABC|nr:ADP-L-glycero-D-manno-heptose-6-epimerase [Granulibacter bethesdensis CGDNIH1]APH52268.1 ADP-L-glycero-D-manno-heptose-6-epimerase [Granulibacter bethesdensis]APH64961.1 ADP-L-glycero-D-manno-heptose-6-epimerase [Granulibacter bethesdensis]